MPLLSRPWQLWNVEDVEALLKRAVERSPHVSNLGADERDELLCHLFEVAWLLSVRFEPGRGSVSFSTFLYSTAQRRTVDWHRSRFRTRWVFGDGRVHERERPQLLSLDDERAGLDEALAGSGVDSDACGFATDMRALEARGRRPGRRDDRLGREAA